jgi:type VI secretion system protein ImpM
MSQSAESAPGFHGKLVAKGDFITRRLPRTFLDPWDSWLQDVIGGSRARMGDAWLDAYLTSPIWRFVLSAGLCGDAAAAGVLMPSVDRVGRYFPLTIIAPLPAGADPLVLPVAGTEWFHEAEELVRSALDDAFDFDGFDARVAALGLPPAGEPGGPQRAPGPRRAACASPSHPPMPSSPPTGSLPRVSSPRPAQPAACGGRADRRPSPRPF